MILTEQEIKNIIYKEHLDLWESLAIIQAFIFEKKQLDIDIIPPNNIFQLNLFMKAREISFGYFLNKYYVI
jgi:hypothetical protein